jgi:hypothetical protein
VSRALSRGATVVWWGLGAWVIWWSVDRGRALQRRDVRVNLGAAPLVGRKRADGWDWRFGWALLVAAAIAAFVIWSWRREWWSRRSDRIAIAGAGLLATAFAVALAATDGADGLFYGAVHPTEYWASLDSVPPAAEFVRTFIVRIDDYSVHVRGHPPGFVLLLKALAHVGLDAAWPVVVLSALATAVTAAAVLVTVRAIAGAAWMHQVLPLTILTPASLWMLTSADAVFTAMGASGVAAIALGCRQPSKARAMALGTVAGLLLGGLLLMTYLGSIFGLLPAALLTDAVIRRRPGAVITGLVGSIVTVAVIAAFARAGFWWYDGVERTRIEYEEGSAQFRTWDYFAIGNFGAALFALGPLPFGGLARLRDRRIWVVVGGAVAALIASHLSKYTRAEVERIWLLFYPWIGVAGAALLGRHRAKLVVVALAAQAGAAIFLQAALVSKW